jgi:hypothetical protein
VANKITSTPPKKTVVIGVGFSAAVAKLLLDEGATVMGHFDSKRLAEFGYVKRCCFEVNKIFSERAFSFGWLNAEIKGVSLHERLIAGGNSRIWGGFIDIKEIPKYFIQLLELKKVYAIPLNLATTGSVSNSSTICQLQDSSGKIFSANQALSIVKDGFLESFHATKEGIELKILDSSESHSSEISTPSKEFVDKLILCVGPVQLIDLLYRSGYIGNDSCITLSEFGYDLKGAFRLRPHIFNENSLILRFSIGRAFAHFIGVRRQSFLIKILNLLPYYFDQKFFFWRSQVNLKIKDGIIVNSGIQPMNVGHKFGESIHYCNMLIDGLHINEFLFKISPNIVALGMACLEQKTPGPISNDIILDAILKIKKDT